MDQLCIPPEVWNCVARYYQNPILLLQLAEICRNSYHGATMDSAWETLIPYECEGSLYRAFIEAALSTTENNRCIIRCCWTGRFPPKDCFPEIAFESKDFDTAFAVAAQKEHLAGWSYGYLVSDKSRHRYLCPEKYSYLFDRCVQSRKFMVTALKFSPWLYDKYYDTSDRYSYRDLSSDAEYCEMAMRYSVQAWVSARRQHFQAWKNHAFRKKMITRYPYAVTFIFSRSKPCSDPEFILLSARYYLNSAECLVARCHPNVFGMELCEKLCSIGFPVWVAKPDIGASFLKKFQCFTKLPPKFENDREIFESVAKNNCRILEHAIPEFRRDISLVLSIFEHDPSVLHYCDASIFTDAEFLRCFREALRKPNDFFFRRWHGRYHPGLLAFPNALQTQELALIAVQCCGQWMHYFPRFQSDFEVMKAAVVTWPLAYGYTLGRLNFGCKWSRYHWSKPICEINPRAVWVAGRRFIEENRSIVRKALQLGPLQSYHDYFPYSKVPYALLAKDIERVLPEVLRAHPRNYGVLCLRKENRRFILRRKKLVIAALEGTRDSSILWHVPPKILDEDIWNKAREVR